MLVYFGTCMVSAILLRLPHLSREAGENDIGACLRQEQQHAEKVDATNTIQHGHITRDLETHSDLHGRNPLNPPPA